MALKANRVIVVDDDAEFLSMLVDFIESLEYKTKGFTSAVEALKTLREASLNGVPIILSDNIMPHMDGMTFLKTMRKESPQIPFIMMTAFGSSETLQSANELGAFAFIKKPFNLKDIEAALLKATKDISDKNLSKEGGEECQNCGTCSCDAIERKRR